MFTNTFFQPFPLPGVKSPELSPATVSLLILNGTFYVARNCPAVFCVSHRRLRGAPSGANRKKAVRQRVLLSGGVYFVSSQRSLLLRAPFSRAFFLRHAARLTLALALVLVFQKCSNIITYSTYVLCPPYADMLTGTVSTPAPDLPFLLPPGARAPPVATVSRTHLHDLLGVLPDVVAFISAEGSGHDGASFPFIEFLLPLRGIAPTPPFNNAPHTPEPENDGAENAKPAEHSRNKDADN